MNNKEVFEAWVVRTIRRAGTHVKKDSNGKYLDNRVASKWTAWQAALAQANEVKQSQAQQTESQWISVEERLPENNCHVLVACKGGNVATTFYSIEHSFFDHAHGYKLSRKVHGKHSKHFELARQYGYKITHWMPLPPAPMNEVNKPEGDDK